MLRIERADGWTLIQHRDHARLAGEFAKHWGNALFTPPEPFPEILVAVSRHDDAWAERDAEPCLTREGRPSAFSKELVGSYSAFEEIDLLEYLAVRGRATETLAQTDPYSAILVSMHTVNLLTEHADLSTLSVQEQAAHVAFLAQQRERQCELAGDYIQAGGDPAAVQSDRMRRAFEFLQACDSLSLLVCVDFPKNSELRHEHPLADGRRTRIQFEPKGEHVYRLSPYPFNRPDLTFTVPARTIRGTRWRTVEAFRGECARSKEEMITIRIVE